MALYDTTLAYSPKAPFTFNNLTGRDIWAFAYGVNPDTGTLTHACLPVKGRVVQVDKLTHKFEFQPYGKSGRLVPSKAVRAVNRCYADTEKQAYDGYNALVARRMKALRRLSDRTSEDLIAKDGEPPKPETVILSSGDLVVAVLYVYDLDARFADIFRNLTALWRKTGGELLDTVLPGLKAAGYTVEKLPENTKVLEV